MARQNKSIKLIKFTPCANQKFMLRYHQLNNTNAMTRSSSRMWDSRELPDGARQSKTNGELASEQPTESGAQASKR